MADIVVGFHGRHPCFFDTSPLTGFLHSRLALAGEPAVFAIRLDEEGRVGCGRAVSRATVTACRLACGLSMRFEGDPSESEGWRATLGASPPRFPCGWEEGLA